MTNPFDQFDNPADKAAGNPFDQFDKVAPSQKASVGALPVAPKKEPKGLGGRIADAAGAGFMSANLEGFGGLVARKGFELSGYGIDKLKAAYPGKSEDWYKSKQKAIINQTVLEARKSEQDKIKGSDLNIPGTEINPIAFAGGMLGGADPTYALGGPISGKIVGAGAKKVAGRVAANAAEQAVYGAATDAAYQGADILDGLQTKFNVERNLLNAGFGAAVGGGLGVAHEVSPFVKGMFEKRKVDTTPSADPRPTADANTPLTGGEPQQSFKDRAAEVIQNGSAEDIHALFKGTNIPSPWRADVAKFVAKRDADRARGIESDPIDISPIDADSAPQSGVWDVSNRDSAAMRKANPELARTGEVEGAAEQYGAGEPKAAEVTNPFDQFEEAAPEAPEGVVDPVQSTPSTVEVPKDPDHIEGVDDEAPYTREEAQAHVQELTKDWKNAPEFEVVDHVDQIESPEVRQYMIDQDPNGDAMGLYGKDGKVRIFADRVPDRATMNAIIYHEALGHHGLATHFGDKMDSVLQTLMDRNVGSFNKAVDDWMKEFPGEYNGSRVRAAEEVMARMSEGGQIKPVWFDAMAKVVRDFARKNGMKLAITDSEIRVILSMAHRAVIDGKSSVAANGFRTGLSNEDGPGAMFMRRSELKAKDVPEQAWEHLSLGIPDHIPMTDAAAEKLARDAAWTPETIKDMRAAGNLKRQVFIYDKLAKETAATMRYLNEKAQGPEGLTADEMADLIEATAQHGYLFNRIINHGTQVARGLEAMKAVSYSRNNLIRLRAELEKQGTNLAALTDPDEARKFLANYVNMLNGGNPMGASQLMTGIGSPYWWQYPLTWRQNMMLSGLSTQVKASTDMFISQTREMGEKWAATAVGGVHPTEPIAQHIGMVKALMDAQTWINAKNTFKQGGVSRHTQTADPRIPWVSKINDALSAQDAFWKAIFVNGQLYALGARQAKEQLGKGASYDHIWSLGESIALNPTNKMFEEANHLAETTILTNKSTFNTALDQAKLIRPGMTGFEQAQKFLINFMTPFMRTASNGLQEQVLRRTPIGFLSKSVREDLAAGGPRRAIALTKMAIGSTLIAYYWNAADSDKKKMTGDGPKSYAKVQELMASGWTPNATFDEKTGRYVRASNLNFSLDPRSTNNAIASTVAGAREAYEAGAKDGDVANALGGAAYTTMRMLAEMTYVGDLADTFGAVTDRTAQGANKFGVFAAKELGSFYPNLATQVHNMVDPNKHDTSGTGPVDSFVNNLPIVNKMGPIKYDAYGKPLKTGTSLLGIPVLGSKGNGIQQTTDEAELELKRLAETDDKNVISAVQKTITVDGESIKLTREQYADYQKQVGEQLVAQVRELMQTEEYQNLSDKEKIKAVRKIQKDVRTEVRGGIQLNDKQQSKVDADDDE